MKKKISGRSRLLLLLGAAFLIASLFVPIWSISLDAPQYPEGLSLQIWANKIAGDVDIINGLNHYIGMKTLHTNDFIEFTVLPYIIAFFALLFILVAWSANKKGLNFLLIGFILFGIVAMADFWKWEYDYGHNLDPNAAIKVPGMAYQPPLIGFKQLLNFGAYSIPDVGGWLFIGAGMLVLIAVILEFKNGRSAKLKTPATALMIASVFLLGSCSNSGPQSIALNKDACDFCKMSISDGRYMAEIITKKGRVYKFDDVSCLIKYAAEQGKDNIAQYYIGNSEKENELIDATTAWYVTHENYKSPMGGNTAAFVSKQNAEDAAAKQQTNAINWQSLNQQHNTAANEHEGHAH